MSTDQPFAVVIDDEADTRDLITAVLTRSGFKVVEATNGRDGIDAVRRHDPVVTTVDVAMPGMDGHATTRRLREFSSTYLIMLSGHDEEIDVIEGLDAGADDYIVKPFRPRELRARVNSVMRRPRDFAGLPPRSFTAQSAKTVPPVVTSLRSVHRAEPAPPVHPSVREAPRQTPVPMAAPAGTATAVLEREQEPAAHDDAVVLRHRGVELDTAAREVRLGEQAIELTRTEFDLLATMLASGRRVRTKADLVLTLRGESFVTDYLVTEADKRAISVHMANLRRKLDEDPAQPRWIETVRGVGYRLTAAA